jgi:hypothetical protein
MKYMLLIYGDENHLSQAEREACFGESAALARDMHENGSYLGASPLQATTTASSVRLREGKRLVTDGPFAETHEQLGGYYLIEVENQEQAFDYAARVPAAKWGTVEVRPIVEIHDLPDLKT